MLFLTRIENKLNVLLGHTVLSEKLLLRKKWTLIWSFVAFFCVCGMTCLAFFMNIPIVFWYGIILIVYYLIYLPILVISKHFERITYFFLLTLILTTFIAIIRLGGLVTSVGLIFVGLTCAFSSVLINKAKWTVQLFLVYAGTIISAAALQPYLKVPTEITPDVNLLFYVLNILWITGTTLIFILSYIHQQSEIEEMEARRLKELDVAKTRLYTNITHEFRTPLTIMLGMADLVEKNPGKWLQKGILEIRMKAKTLLLIVNQMLDLAQLESGLLSIKLVNGDIIRYLKYLTESFASMAEHRKIELLFKSPQREFHMDYDAGKIMQILSNLLSNAFKYTRKGGKIEVNAWVNQTDGQDNFFIEVQDSGIGMKEEYLSHIFDRFYRIPDDQENSSSGSGLGLAYTKELVKLLDGQISVHSQPGKEPISAYVCLLQRRRYLTDTIIRT